MAAGVEVSRRVEEFVQINSLDEKCAGRLRRASAEVRKELAPTRQGNAAPG